VAYITLIKKISISFIFVKDGCCTVLQLKMFLQLNPAGSHFKAMQDRRMAFFTPKVSKPWLMWKS